MLTHLQCPLAPCPTDAEDNLVTKRSLIILQYLYSWMIVDVIAVLPYEYMTGGDGGNADDAATLAKVSCGPASPAAHTLSPTKQSNCTLIIGAFCSACAPVFHMALRYPLPVSCAADSVLLKDVAVQLRRGSQHTIAPFLIVWCLRCESGPETDQVHTNVESLASHQASSCVEGPSIAEAL